MFDHLYLPLLEIWVTKAFSNTTFVPHTSLDIGAMEKTVSMLKIR